jgi:nucleotide-binding universal stress UspA family protein
MFKHLLVPLDGSELSEEALPAALYLARTIGAQVTLLHVIEHNPPDAVHGQRHITTVEEGAGYLASTIQSVGSDAMIGQHVHPNRENDVARSIVDHAEEMGIDLIIMCTHGRSSLRRWLFGSIAQRVIAMGETPVLLIHPNETRFGHAFACRQIMAPLDGDPAHEAGLRVSLALAQECAAKLHLVMVVPTPETLTGEGSATARLLPATTAAVLEISQESAMSYLNRQAKLVTGKGVVASTEVCRGEPSAAIALAAQTSHADLLVMATHGKTHMDAFWSGSVTPRVSSRSHRPILLVPVSDKWTHEPK